ncbi:alpha/beta fold hydrolase [Aliivibrio finisterrensis]|uniref:alpha/beta fold hydrolase n=1 Tax=Aliivibrio finisterrensis TaxID=511998 RepID=UPI0010227E85|nr:alpha/beta fold hydrolase [Aliivibrio finisterrensis]RYU71113.1 alpha/beta fold hydrolase [Aliivibrio finisterrensis]RYU74842.1 alpha/beta fold hydrolase [Aliivibrio finisterrensis]RYU77287.1 alpha/beta fold hydrolase [Aliivibrio finisterrensis]
MKQLNYKEQGNGDPLILIHGLFGNLDNLGLLARQLENQYRVISIDLRNHGLSFHSEDHSYPLLASDVIQLLAHLSISSAHIIGHSMGGKVAMAIADQKPDLIKSLIVLDMAPISYPERKHDAVFAGLHQVIQSPPKTRKEADALLATSIIEPGVRQFLSKSLYKKDECLSLRFNVAALLENYHHIIGWNNITPFTGNVLFVKGENSDYILPEHQNNIMAQFPNAKAHIVSGTGHWLHAEKPETIYRIINRFIEKVGKR